MLQLGLTGGIASGKSTVAALLREFGFPVLDADSLAHKLIEPGEPAFAEIVQYFGSSLIDPRGFIDRAKLSVLVFSDPSKLARLNAIVHPRVEDAIFRQFRNWQRDDSHCAALVEAALLLEAGYLNKLDGLVVAWCSPEQQLARLRARGLTEAEARSRIAAQLPVSEKLLHATETIDCSDSLEKTRQQVAALAEKLRSSASHS